MNPLPDLELSYYFAVLQALEGATRKDDGLVEAMDEYRMACTNLPISFERIASSKEVLVRAMATRADLVEKVEAIVAVHTTSLSAGPKSSYLTKSCYVQQEMQCVFPGLFVGSYHPAAKKDLLQRHKITHICCCIDVLPRFPEVFSYLCLSADDRAGYDMSQHFSESFSFIDEAVVRGSGVLVHCGAGISRAPTILAAYLVRKLGIGALQAISMIRKVRSCAAPNLGFVQQLKEFEARLKDEKATHNKI